MGIELFDDGVDSSKKFQLLGIVKILVDCFDFMPGDATDCNFNQIPDLCDIMSGFSTDTNGNNRPDECDPPCPADFDEDGAVDVDDFFGLIAAWGPNPGHPADLDGSGVVDVVDFFMLIGLWGPCG